jgi:hypothetical protein
MVAVGWLLLLLVLKGDVLVRKGVGVIVSEGATVLAREDLSGIYA